MIVTDSQAGLRALQGVNGGWENPRVARVASAGRALGREGKKLVFVWVPGHCGLVGNEWADAAAGEAASGPQGGVECSFESIKGLWKRREKEREWRHERSRMVYEGGTKRDKEKDWTRKEAVSMARFRSGHSLELGGYRKRIGLEEDGRCRRCECEDESVEHVMECVAGVGKRLELNINDLSDLCCRPREALLYWEWWKRARRKPRE